MTWTGITQIGASSSERTNNQQETMPQPIHRWYGRLALFEIVADTGVLLQQD